MSGNTETYKITASTSTKKPNHPKRLDEISMDYRNGLNACIKKMNMGTNALISENDPQTDITQSDNTIKKGRIEKINDLINKIPSGTVGQQGVSSDREKQINDIMDTLEIKRDMTMTAQSKLNDIHDHCKDFVSIKLGEIDMNMDQVKIEVEKIVKTVNKMVKYKFDEYIDEDDNLSSTFSKINMFLNDILKDRKSFKDIIEKERKIF
jgi:hypothetical protein